MRLCVLVSNYSCYKCAETQNNTKGILYICKNTRSLNMINKIILVLSLLFGLTVVSVYSQVRDEKFIINGTVTDEKEEPLPFVNIYLKGTTHGTTSNVEGNFSLSTNNSNEVELVFQYVGYKKVNVRISPGSGFAPINIQLFPEQIMLKEAIISADREDPAYQIIRNAIAMRKYYLRQVDSYSTKMYMKSNITLDEIPDKFFLIPKKEMPDSSDLGLLYLSESVSIYNFQKPDKRREEMIASKVAGQEAGYSFNRAEIVLLNFYKNLVNIGFSERGFISPIANNAMFYYKYRLIDSFQENENIIHKIEVMPKRKSDNIFMGYIYIVDKRWNIHSLNLKITKHSQVEFIDSVRVRQLYIPANDSVWMPLSLHFVGYFKLFGFRASTNFIAFFTEYEINKEFPEGFFNKEIFSVKEESTKRDSAFWVDKRQTVLTDKEINNYKEGDSLLILRESKEYQDSVNRENNKFRPLNLLWNGYSYNNWFKKYSWGVNSIIDGLASFNTVEGLSINVKPWYTKTFEDEHILSLTSSFKYSFTSRRVNSYISAYYRFNNFNYQYLSLSGGKYVFQYCRPDPISDFINSIYTLFVKENYAKYFGQSYARASFGREIFNGLDFNVSAEYARREALLNSTHYSLIKYPDKEFTSNNPQYPDDDSQAFETNDAMIFALGFIIKFGQRYAMYPKRKIRYESKYPIIRLKYRKGFNIGGSDMSFDHFELGIFDNLNLRQLGVSSVSISGGVFFNKRNVCFLDYKHFSGNRTIFLSMPGSSISIGASGTEFGNSGYNNFEAMEYYSHSTDNLYFQAHYEHHFNGWIINKIPLIRKTKIQVVGGVNFLYTEDIKEYFEITAGLEHIFKILRIDLVSGYSGSSVINPQVRIGAGF